MAGEPPCGRLSLPRSLVVNREVATLSLSNKKQAQSVSQCSKGLPSGKGKVEYLRGMLIPAFSPMLARVGSVADAIRFFLSAITVEEAAPDALRFFVFTASDS